MHTRKGSTTAKRLQSYGRPASRQVMIVCPKNGVEVATGFTVVSADRLDRIRVQPLMFRCSSCYDVHLWSKDDAFLR